MADSVRNENRSRKQTKQPPQGRIQYTSKRQKKKHEKGTDPYIPGQFISRRLLDDAQCKHMEPGKLFPPTKKGSTILIHGKPGMGKTWLLDWFMDRWTTEGWGDDYPCVLLLDIASLKTLKTPLTLLELLVEHSIHKTSVDTDQLSIWIKSESHRIVLLLDDIESLDQNKLKRQVKNEVFRTLASDWCTNILNGHALPKACKIVTSRHLYTDKAMTVVKRPLKNKEIGCIMTLADLNWLEINEFVQKKVSPEKIHHVLSTLENDKHLLSLCGNPQICSTMCDILQDSDTKQLTYSRVTGQLLLDIPSNTKKGQDDLFQKMITSMTRLKNFKYGIKKISYGTHYRLPSPSKDDGDTLPPGIVYYKEKDIGFGRSQCEPVFVNPIFQDMVSVGCLLREKDPDIKHFFEKASDMGRYFLAAMTHDNELKVTLNIPQLSKKVVNDIREAVKETIQHQANPQCLMNAFQLIYECQLEDLAEDAFILMTVETDSTQKMTAIARQAQKFTTLICLKKELADNEVTEKNNKQLLKEREQVGQSLKNELIKTAHIEESLQRCRTERQDLETQLDEETLTQNKAEEQLRHLCEEIDSLEMKVVDKKETQCDSEAQLEITQHKKRRLQAIQKVVDDAATELLDKFRHLQDGAQSQVLKKEKESNDSEKEQLKMDLTKREAEEQTQKEALATIKAEKYEVEIKLLYSKTGKEETKKEANDIENAIQETNALLNQTRGMEQRWEKKQAERDLVKDKLKEAEEQVEQLKIELSTIHEMRIILIKKIKELQQVVNAFEDDGAHITQKSKTDQEETSHDTGTVEAVDGNEAPCERTSKPETATMVHPESHCNPRDNEAHNDATTSHNTPYTSPQEGDDKSINEIQIQREEKEGQGNRCIFRYLTAQLSDDELLRIQKVIHNKTSLELLEICTLPSDCVDALMTFITKKRKLTEIRSTTIKQQLCLQVSTSCEDQVIYCANKGHTEFQLASACLQAALSDFLMENSIPSAVDVNSKKLALFVTQEQKYLLEDKIHARISDLQKSYGCIAYGYELFDIEHKLQMRCHTGHKHELWQLRENGICFPGCMVKFDCTDGSVLHCTGGPLLKDGEDKIYLLSSCHGEKVEHCYLLETTPSHTKRHEIKFIEAEFSRSPLLDACLMEVDDDRVKGKCHPFILDGNRNIALCGPYTGLLEDLKDEKVLRYSRATHLTKGVISHCTFSLPSDDITNALVITSEDGSMPFAQEGDSGSVIFLETPEGKQKNGILLHEALAMHTGGLEGFKNSELQPVLAFKLDSVLERFQKHTSIPLEIISGLPVPQQCIDRKQKENLNNQEKLSKYI